jgi:hypothetical protein
MTGVMFKMHIACEIDRANENLDPGKGGRLKRHEKKEHQ